MPFLKNRILLLFTFTTCLLALLLAPLSILAATWTNGGFNNPFNTIPGRVWNGQNEKIANGWTPFYIDANTYPGSGNASKLHWMSSAQFGATFGGLDYHIEGDAAQNMWSSYEFDAGVYQQVDATPGAAYEFDIAIVTYWRGPGYPDTNGKMVKRVGIDPYGGTDPASSNVIWSNTDSNDKAWIRLRAAATAEANIVTVFAKVYAPENDSFNHTDLDMVYFEDAHFNVSGPPPTTAVNSSLSGTTVNATWSGSAGSGWALKGYEVQYKDQAGGNWIVFQDKSSTNTGGSFAGQPGHSYTIRARTWQTNGNVDLPGAWVEDAITINEVVVGRVMDHTGSGLNGVTVSIDGTAISTSSVNGGNYALSGGGPGTFNIVAGNHNGLVAPPAASVTVPTNGIATLDITLRPTGSAQAITNNDFETDLSGWNSSDASAASVAAAAKHSGGAGLHLTQTVQISQTNAVANMPNPLLSFWYKSDASFSVDLLGTPIGNNAVQAQAIGPIKTQALNAVAGWTHVTLDMNLTDAYTGEVGVNFSYSGGPASIAIDEVSIAAGPASRVYLPILFRD